MAAGATVIATSSSDDKLAIAKQLGAHFTINYRETPNWSEEVMKITGGKGVDFVLDVAGAGTVEQSLSSTRLGGLVSIVGILTPAKEIDIVPAILYGAKAGEYNTGSVNTMTGLQLLIADFMCPIVRGQLGASKEMAEELVRRMEAGKIHPVIGKAFEWDEAKEAFKLMMEQSAVGKIVIKGVAARSL